jgi:hypothetical protein
MLFQIIQFLLQFGQRLLELKNVFHKGGRSLGSHRRAGNGEFRPA